VAREALGDDIPLAVISGPTFAKELAAGLPTAISLAATDPQFAEDLQHLLHCGKSFRVYINPDFIGVQLGGAVKNVIAIGAGMSDGIGFGANARTALITRGLVEMSASARRWAPIRKPLWGWPASVTWCSPAPTTSPVTVASA
jgi:glycerol-3-phosphate dehydrogenase (NAD(P)+)